MHGRRSLETGINILSSLCFNGFTSSVLIFFNSVLGCLVGPVAGAATANHAILVDTPHGGRFGTLGIFKISSILLFLGGRVVIIACATAARADVGTIDVMTGVYTVGSMLLSLKIILVMELIADKKRKKRLHSLLKMCCVLPRARLDSPLFHV